MDISLIHAGLAAGAALAVVPLIIHLVMRQTPKRIVFPALRLLQQRHQRSTKRLKVKNWLLLLARMALVALMALALARPALNARVPLGDREVPTALAMIIDTSLSMGYVEQGKRSRQPGPPQTP
jgi:multisubunit Na+/H+ antiporter MnhB subunit